MLLKFISPVETYTLVTKSEKEEIMARVKDLVDKSEKGFYFIGKSKYRYKGETGANNFLLRQSRQSNNILLPAIKAEIEKLKTGSMLNIKIELSTLSKLFLIVWGLGILAICGLLANISVQSGKINADFFIPFFTLIAFYSMMISGYRLNIHREKKFINTFLETASRVASEKTYR